MTKVLGNISSERSADGKTKSLPSDARGLCRCSRQMIWEASYIRKIPAPYPKIKIIVMWDNVAAWKDGDYRTWQAAKQRSIINEFHLHCNQLKFHDCVLYDISECGRQKQNSVQTNNNINVGLKGEARLLFPQHGEKVTPPPLVGYDKHFTTYQTVCFP